MVAMMMAINEYDEFLTEKIQLAGNGAATEMVGFEVDTARLHPSAYPHQRDAIVWACGLGRALLGMSFGMGKTHCQIEIGRLIHEQTTGRFLIVAPLGVKHVFTDEEGPRLGVKIQYVRNDAEVLAADTPILITNYERVRDGGISPALFDGVSLDEGSVLRTLGTKTTRRFIEAFTSVPYRFVATATPAPNRYLELINYARFMGVMDDGQARTRWFKRNSTTAHDLQLLPNQEKEFWLWVASWALFLNKPSDLGYSDEGYSLPEMRVHWHRIGVDHTRAWGQQSGKNGQRRLILDGAAGITEASQEKRATMADRVERMVEIMDANPDRHWLLWHHLEDERRAITSAWPGAVAVFGSQPLERKEELILGFSRGEFPVLATKPEIAGSGCNFQKFCADNIFLGVSYEFEDFIQAIHRTHRYGQDKVVNVHIIYAESEDGIVEVLKRKWAQHNHLVAEMQAIMQRYGLSIEAMRQTLMRKMGVQRQESAGAFYTLVNNDCVLEIPHLADDSVDHIMTSIPFGDQYEYVASYNDFGHNEDNAAFFRQMGFLLPELLRVLKPGRVAAIHCKDRVRPGKYNAHGVPTIEPFSDEVTRQFIRAGFVYAGRITLATDVVRENAQTYRLGWSEMAKDGSKMGVGMPEYIQLFRKAPSDSSNAYADEPVRHDKGSYTRARWQVDAHAFWRSDGDRLLEPGEIAAYNDLSVVYQTVKKEQVGGLYSYERHVAVCEALDEAGKLPATFMLCPTQSVSGGVWTDIMQARTLNTTQSQRRLQNHVCPLPLDIVGRCIERYSNPGDLVLDPFCGLGTVPYLAVKMGRRGYGVDLSEMYWETAVGYCHAAEQERQMPSLFDFVLAVQKNEQSV
jgi:DNA modification methylase